jgi:2-C-methyl-D-erythritol 4-phosphate cytidylyltransferase
VARPCVPQPITVSFLASARARYFAATAVAAAVRKAVISAESRIATVVPRSQSITTITPWIVGS